MAQAEKLQDKKPINPLLWISIVVVGLILAILLMSNRGGVSRQNTPAPAPARHMTEKTDHAMIDRGADSSAATINKNEVMDDRGSSSTASTKKDEAMDDTGSGDMAASEQDRGAIKRNSQAAPGVRARAFIKQLRNRGKPYPFDKLLAKAGAYAAEGSLADAYLSYFFAAREGSTKAMMMMAEMSDPTMFRPESNLLDKPDPALAYRWYKRARDAGFEPAQSRLDNLHQWAISEARIGNEDARQLLLNY